MKHRALRPAACAIALAAFLAAACSHTNPYVRPDALLPPLAAAPGNENGVLGSRIILIGDAGEADAVVLEEAASWAARRPERTIVVYLGDNMYPEGMTRRRRHEADQRLLPQIQAAGQARVLFVPGNHDWANGRAEGHDAILEQAAYINGRLPYEGFLPAGGCPGPAVIDDLRGVRIVAIDTQWWLHRKPPSWNCPGADPERLAEELARATAGDRHVVIVAHHPLAGYGRHSGFSDWRDHLRPPVMGSLIALARKLPLRRQDQHSQPYRAMVDFFQSALRTRTTEGALIWAAGHEHNLQVLEGDFADYVLISGSGAKTTPVTDGRETLFAQSSPGFMVLDLLDSGQLLLRIIQSGRGEVFSAWLHPEAR